MSNPSLLLILRKKIMILMLNNEHNFPMTEKQQDLRMCKPTNGKVEFLRCDTQVINSEGCHPTISAKIMLSKVPKDNYNAKLRFILLNGEQGRPKLETVKGPNPGLCNRATEAVGSSVVQLKSILKPKYAVAYASSLPMNFKASVPEV
ncbi:hypothetical protein P5673_013606 [Acropora cervicornis]|uniref:Uncharacterized protein n=1 Tax=Acropora cervicornis TaxID=6130 RepID=A0AAD9QLN5_ACRCE|nr:hypothetical protein P5673_013606 [Acropora cervicornis]